MTTFNDQKYIFVLKSINRTHLDSFAVAVMLLKFPQSAKACSYS